MKKWRPMSAFLSNISERWKARMLPELFPFFDIYLFITYPLISLWKAHKLLRESEPQLPCFLLKHSAKCRLPPGRKTEQLAPALFCMVCFYFSFALPKVSGSSNNSSQIQTCQPSPVLLRTCMWKVSRHWYLAVCGVCTSKLLSGWVWSAAVGSQTGSSLPRWSKASLGKHCLVLLLHVQYTPLYMDVYAHYYITYAYTKIHIYYYVSFTELR